MTFEQLKTKIVERLQQTGDPRWVDAADDMSELPAETVAVLEKLAQTMTGPTIDTEQLDELIAGMFFADEAS